MTAPADIARTAPGPIAIAGIPWRTAFAAILVAAALLRFAGLGWDDGLLLHPDERNLVVAAERLDLSGLPRTEFYAYHGLAQLLPRLLADAVSDGPAQAATIAVAARAISAGASVLCVLLGGWIAARIDGAQTGLLAAGLLAFSAPLIQWAHFGTTESALAVAVLALWLVALLYLDKRLGLAAFALASGAILGLALGLKSTPALFLPLPVAAILVGEGGPARKLAWTAASAALAAALFVASTPGVLADTARYLDVMRFERGVLTGAADVFWTWQFDGARDGLFELRQLALLLPAGMLPLAMLGLVLAVRRRSLEALLVLPFLVLYLGMTVSLHAKFVRYLAPCVPVLLIFAAIALRWLLAVQPSRALRALALAALVAFAVIGLGQSASYLGPDPRIAMAEEIARRARPGDLVLVEPNEVRDPRMGAAATEVLPLTAPPGEDKLGALADALSRGRFLLLDSRRNWSVLPRQTERFPAMCGYYRALVEERLGYRVVHRTARPRLLSGLTSPGLAAEETAVVFDAPRSVLFARTAEHDAAHLRREIEAAGDGCDPRTVLAQFARRQ